MPDSDLDETFVRFVQLAMEDKEIGDLVRRMSAAPADGLNKLLTQTAAVMRARKSSRCSATRPCARSSPAC